MSPKRVCTLDPTKSDVVLVDIMDNFMSKTPGVLVLHTHTRSRPPLQSI